MNFENYLTPTEVSKLLKVPLSTIYSWVFQRKIPFLKIGRHLRFDSIELQNWIKEQQNG